jgi:hypothetical protein
MQLPGMTKWLSDEDEQVHKQTVWTEENSKDYVVAAIKYGEKLVANKSDFKNFMAKAHDFAAQAKAKNQPQYDLAFAKNLLILLGVENPETWEPTCSCDWEIPPLPLPQVSVATAEPVEQPKPADDRSNWTVEDWERSGVQFRPAATRVVNILQQPVEDRTRRAKPTYANNLPEAPWGSRAVAMVKWAWIQAFPSERLGGNRADEIAHILSVLYHAGILKEGSITPVGMGRAKIVRGKPTKL